MVESTRDTLVDELRDNGIMSNSVRLDIKRSEDTPSRLLDILRHKNRVFREVIDVFKKIPELRAIGMAMETELHQSLPLITTGIQLLVDECIVLDIRCSGLINY